MFVQFVPYFVNELRILNFRIRYRYKRLAIFFLLFFAQIIVILNFYSSECKPLNTCFINQKALIKRKLDESQMNDVST